MSATLWATLVFYILTAGVVGLALLLQPFSKGLRNAVARVLDLVNIRLRSPVANPAFGIFSNDISIRNLVAYFAFFLAFVNYVAWHQRYVSKRPTSFQSLGVEMEWKANKWRAERGLYMDLGVGIAYIAIDRVCAQIRNIKAYNSAPQ